MFRAEDDDEDKRPSYKLTEQQQMCIEDVRTSIQEFRQWKQEQILEPNATLQPTPEPTDQMSNQELILEQEATDATPQPTPEPTLEPNTTLEPTLRPDPTLEPTLELD